MEGVKVRGGEAREGAVTEGAVMQAEEVRGGEERERAVMEGVAMPAEEVTDGEGRERAVPVRGEAVPEVERVTVAAAGAAGARVKGGVGVVAMEEGGGKGREVVGETVKAVVMEVG